LEASHAHRTTTIGKKRKLHEEELNSCRAACAGREEGAGEVSERLPAAFLRVKNMRDGDLPSLYILFAGQLSL
jgi:hypothetical protein